MAKAQMIAAAVLASIGMTASSQVNTAAVQIPVSGRAAMRQSLSAAQTRVLVERFEARPATQALTIDPNKVREVAGPQTKPVVVSPAAPASANLATVIHPVNVSAPPPSTNPARVEFLQTTPDEEKLLRQAVAGQQALQPALAAKGASLVTLPGLVRMTEGQEQIQLKPFVLVDQALRRDSTGAFTAQLLVGVTELGNTDAIRQLPTPLLFQIVGADRIDPPSILIPTTSPPFSKVQVWIDAVLGASAELKFVSVLNREGTSISLPVRGELSIEPVVSTIDGLGLEATKVNVSLEGVANPNNLQVMLHADSGYLDPNIVSLGPNGAASATLRSDLIGKTTISARLAGLSIATAPVWFRIPFLTILASLVGGLAGGFASFALYPDRRRQALFSLSVSAVFGLIGFMLYAVGINILPVAPTVTAGIALAFAFSALCGFVGPGIVPWAPKPKEEG